MKTFLSDERRNALTSQLTDLGITSDDIAVFIGVEDDLFEVDTAMAAHVLVVVQTRENGQWEHARIGLLILQTLMAEALERGYPETDFPMMLHAVKEDYSRLTNSTTTLQ